MEPVEPNTPPEPTYEQTVRSHFDENPDAFQGIVSAEDVERTAFDVMDKTVEGQALMERIQDARDKGKQDEAAVAGRARLWRKISIEVSLATGVEIEAAEHEKQRNIYKTALRETINAIDPKSDDEEVMVRLGMIKPATEKTRRVFTFPSQILPPYIKEQWEGYVGMIEQFDDANRKLKAGVITQADFDAIDRVRTTSHDSVASSLGEMLEFPEWELEDYRHLVGKMRDEKFAESKGEMATYAKLVREKIIPPEHLTTISRQIGTRAVGQN